MNFTLAFIKPNWQFPVVLDLAGLRVPIHPVCDCLAYTMGFRLFLYLKKRQSGPCRSFEQDTWILLGCVFGALLGAKALALAEAPALYWAMRDQPGFWFGGKTIVGGLLGGWIGVEAVKASLGVTGSVGDLCVFPVILGMCIGRVGCFLTGLADNTYGVCSSLPWAVDFGDGIPRHPTQIYEILFLASLALILWSRRFSFTAPGVMFRWFMASYLAFRFIVDFYKPHWTMLGGLSGIQWGALLGFVYCIYSLMRLEEKPSSRKQHV